MDRELNSSIIPEARQSEYDFYNIFHNKSDMVFLFTSRNPKNKRAGHFAPDSFVFRHVFNRDETLSDCWKVALKWLPPRRKKLSKNRGVWGAECPTHPYFSKVFFKVLSKIYLWGRFEDQWQIKKMGYWRRGEFSAFDEVDQS